MSERVHYHREWLNNESQGGHAYIESQIDFWRESSLDAYFNFADCNRQISLDFCCYADNPDGIKNVQEKLRKMRNALATFEAELLLRIGQLKKEKPAAEPEVAS